MLVKGDAGLGFCQWVLCIGVSVSEVGATWRLQEVSCEATVTQQSTKGTRQKNAQGTRKLSNFADSNKYARQFISARWHFRDFECEEEMCSRLR
jgi:hypothetical protein